MTSCVLCPRRSQECSLFLDQHGWQPRRVRATGSHLGLAPGQFGVHRDRLVRASVEQCLQPYDPHRANGLFGGLGTAIARYSGQHLNGWLQVHHQNPVIAAPWRYRFLILCFIIFTHVHESFSIIDNMIDLTNISIPEIRWNATFFATLSLAYIFAQSFFSRKIKYWGLIFLLIIGSLVPLIAAFGLYFIVQHSINAWEHLKNGLSTNNISLYKKALPYTMGAVLLFLIIVILYNNVRFEIDQIISLFFIFLASISLPHVILMHGFYANKNKKLG